MDGYYDFPSLYDEAARGVPGDIEFYRDLAVASGGPVVELGVGTGRIAVPTAAAGVDVIGIDSSPAMLAVARERAREAGVEARLRLVEGDMRHFVLDAPVPLVTIPFRTFLHNLTAEDQRATLEACRRALRPGGRLALNVFNPDLALLWGWSLKSAGRAEPYGAGGRIAARHDHEPARRVVTTRMRWRDGGAVRHASMALRYVDRDEMAGLLAGAGFEVEALSADFAGAPFEASSTEQVWLARVSHSGG